MVDPYLYPGTNTLINKFQIQDAKKLQDLEAAFYRLRVAELPLGNFDYDHLKLIHQHLFGDIYDWAGKERTINIIKGYSHFARKEFISLGLNNIFSKLHSDNFLKDLNHSDFCQELAYYFNEINAAHPFREGNGRSLRSFCTILSESAGFSLDWTKIPAAEYIQANIQGFNGDYKGMELVFSKAAASLNRDHTLKLIVV